jgi:radical SAM superfamily enzyme YgiQ (UPF0313 family)
MRFDGVLILNPPSPPGYTANKDSMGGFGQLYAAAAAPAPPLDLPYLAAYLRREGILVEVLEAGALRLGSGDCLDRIAALTRPERWLVIVRTSLPTIDFDLEFCAQLRRRIELGGVALTGSVLPSIYFLLEGATGVDFALLGEADETAAELVRGEPLASIRGLAYRDPSGAWQRNEPRPDRLDLDSLPFPAWDLFPVERYRIPKSAVEGDLRFLPMLTSRGCPYGCDYCPYPVGQGLRWRSRSPGNVVDELEQLVREFGIEYVIFRDPMFSMNQGRVREICREIEARGLRVGWRCETRLDCLDRETIAAMAHAGCHGINFGIESSDAEIQRGVGRRPISREEFARKIALCKEYGIETFAFFIVGLPGDTIASILDSIEFALAVSPSWVQFTVSTPFIGTRLHSWAVERGLVDERFYRIVSSHQGSVGNDNLSPEQVHKLHAFARFLQENLLNRHGVLKNAARRDPAYRWAKRAADALCGAMASQTLRWGRWRFLPQSPPSGGAAQVT